MTFNYTGVASLMTYYVPVHDYSIRKSKKAKTSYPLKNIKYNTETLGVLNTCSSVNRAALIEAKSPVQGGDLTVLF